MPGLIVYVDTSEVKEGVSQELEVAIKELVDFVEANEPRILAYNVYLSGDDRGMTVVHLHRDSASLEFHMDIGGPLFRKFVDLVTLRSIEVYGDPSAKVIEQLHAKAKLLGGATVKVHRLHAGFNRLTEG